jgi:hypothetical protein
MHLVKKSRQTRVRLKLEFTLKFNICINLYQRRRLKLNN